MKRSGPIPRTSPLRSGGRPKSRVPIVRINKKRKASEFARCYHSRERVRFIKGLPCLACAGMSAFFALGCGPSDNAHTVTDGMGRKAGYDTIVPLCRTHHSRYDQHQTPFDNEAAREAMQSAAARIQTLWEARCRD